MKPTLLYLLLMIALSLVGCAPADSTALPTITKTQLPSPTVVSVTSTPSPAPTITATLTPPVTLEPERAKETIRTLLQESIDCAAPCFWGIVPGQTTLGEATNIFTRLGLPVASTTYEKKDFHGIVYKLNSGLSVDVTLTMRDNIVENLRVEILPEKQKGVPREWQAYSPESLIARYGVPSKVDIGVDTGPRTFFDMVMYFAPFDLIVQYAGYGIVATDTWICPLSEQYDDVRIWFGENPEHSPGGGVPLEKATSLTLEEFAALMMGEPEKACFNLRAEAFP